MARRDDAAREAPPRACCLISELIEETGLDREHVRALRKQLLEGMIMLCRWQLERMDASDAARAERRGPSRRRGRRIPVEQG